MEVEVNVAGRGGVGEVASQEVEVTSPAVEVEVTS